MFFSKSRRYIHHSSFAAVIVPMRFSKKLFFGPFQTKKVEAFQRLQKQGSNPRYHDFFFTCSAEAKKSFVEPQVECCKRDNNSAMKNGFALQLLVERRKKTWITKGSSYCYFFVFLHKVRWRLVDRKIKQQLGNFSGNKLKKELWENYRETTSRAILQKLDTKNNNIFSSPAAACSSLF